jgi:hypothetical protein
MKLTVTNPSEALDRILVRVHRAAGRNTSVTYDAEPEWEAWLHRQLDLPWPCPAHAEFEEVWEAAIGRIHGRGLQVGRAAYGGWDDADPGLARAVWCLTAHLAPPKVVETGVARGVTSRVILEALERNGSGHLWSIDLPTMDATIHGEIGAAVPDDLRGRWTYLGGTSRHVLPSLLTELGEIGLFVHDSSHTRRNVSFELNTARPRISPGGALLADDVNRSAAFKSFAAAHPDVRTAVASADDRKAMFGIALTSR